MAYNVKYRIEFKDSIDAQYTLDMCFLDYAGNIIPVIGAEDPVIFTQNGDEDNIFTTIHTSKVEINLYQDQFIQSLYDDINSLTDRTCFVKIDSDKGFIWRGWLIPSFSKKSFNKAALSQTLQAVDMFSYLKSAKAVDSEGKIMYGKHSLISLLENAFSKALIGAFEYEITDNLTFSNTAPELSGKNILEQVAIAAESFNDESGRPPYCYDLIEKILHGMGLCCWLRGEKVIISDITSVDRDIYKEIGIKQPGQKTEILIEDDEVITNQRAAKEISAQFKYNRTTGILPDGFFSDWSGDSLQPLTDWEWNSEGVIAQVGNGRPESAYGVKLQTRAYEIEGVGFEEISSLRNTPYRVLLTDSSYKIDFKVKYQDWRAWAQVGLPNPQLQFGMLLEGLSGKRYTLWQENGYSKDQSLWVEMPKDGSGNYVRTIDTFYTGSQLYTRRSISLDSTAATQKLSYNIPALPEDGTLYVYIASAYLSPELSDLVNHNERSDLIYYSVILSENLSVNANGVGGEKHYLTNFGEYALIEDTENFELETGLNESVAGAIYTAIDFNIPFPEITGGHYPVGAQINWMNYASNSPLTFFFNFSLIKGLLAKRMYYKRFPNNRIDLTFRSNTVFFGDLIKLIEGEAELMPSLYLQMNDKFYLKSGRHETTVIELTGEYRFPFEGGAPNATSDSYEFYYQTND